LNFEQITNDHRNKLPGAINMHATPKLQCLQ